MSLIDRGPSHDDKLALLRAFEVEFDSGPDAALAALATPSVSPSPSRTRAQLEILCRAGRFQDAADLVQREPPHEEWVWLAASARSAIGDMTGALHLVEYADNVADRFVMRRTRLAVAESTVDRWIREYAPSSLLSVDRWHSDHPSAAQQLILILEPCIAGIQSNRGISDPADLRVATVATICAYICGNRDVLDACVVWLVDFTPLPLIVAELCLRGITPFDRSYPTRLRSEHDSSFDALYCAVLLDIEFSGSSATPLDSLEAMADICESDTQRERVCLALFGAIGGLNVDSISRALSLVRRLRPQDTRLARLLNAIRLMAIGETAEAGQELTACRSDEDALWWQVYAAYCQVTDDASEEQIAWERAAELMPHPDILHRSIHAALRRKQYASAIRTYEKLLLQSPDDSNHLRGIAGAYIRLGDFANASEHLSRLIATPEHTISDSVQLAFCLRQLADSTGALSVLQSARDAGELPLEGIYLLSELLDAQADRLLAFSVLEEVAADNWADPRFVHWFMVRAYGAGREDSAHDAFVRLLELKRLGALPQDLVQEGTLEDLLRYGEAYRQRRDVLHGEIVSGRLPWLLAEDMLGNAAAWAWCLRTQDLTWLAEDRMSRAAYTLYATDGFAITVSDAGRKLERLRRPEKGESFVWDLTVIMTLFHLNLLDEAAEVFGVGLLPARLGELAATDLSRLGLPQPSRQTSLQAIRDAIDAKLISVIPSTGASGVVVDEYAAPETGDEYRLRDVINAVATAQAAPKSTIAKALALAHKPARYDDGNTPLRQGAALSIRLLTLQTLVACGLLDVVSRLFTLSISESDRDSMTSQLNAMRKVSESRQTHCDMWSEVNRLVRSGHFQWQTVVKTEADQDQTSLEPSGVYLDAVQLASDRRLRVAADDRNLLALRGSFSPSETPSAFGSDILCEGLYAAGAISLQRYGELIQTLMRWRYRFIVPPAQLLVHWARLSADTPPGQDLISTAFYLHECLRDPGLHCGPEDCEPPVSIAFQLVQAWITEIVRMIMTIWDDDSYSTRDASALTRWVARELLPSAPRGLKDHPGAGAVAKAFHASTLSLAIIQAGTLRNLVRGNRALRTLSSALGVSDSEMFTLTASCIEASRSRKEIDNE